VWVKFRLYKDIANDEPVSMLGHTDSAPRIGDAVKIRIPPYVEDWRVIDYHWELLRDDDANKEVRIVVDLVPIGDFVNNLTKQIGGHT